MKLKHAYDQLYFPSGVRVIQIKKDARRLTKTEGVKHNDALDRLARENGINAPWFMAIPQLPYLEINKLKFTAEKLAEIIQTWKAPI
jgi:hypothetical protein